jgi:hypothetical protein
MQAITCASAARFPQDVEQAAMELPCLPMLPTALTAR